MGCELVHDPALGSLFRVQTAAGPGDCLFLKGPCGDGDLNRAGRTEAVPQAPFDPVQWRQPVGKDRA